MTSLSLTFCPGIHPGNLPDSLNLETCLWCLPHSVSSHPFSTSSHWFYHKSPCLSLSIPTAIKLVVALMNSCLFYLQSLRCPCIWLIVCYSCSISRHYVLNHQSHYRISLKHLVFTRIPFCYYQRRSSNFLNFQ